MSDENRKDVLIEESDRERSRLAELVSKSLFYQLVDLGFDVNVTNGFVMLDVDGEPTRVAFDVSVSRGAMSNQVFVEAVYVHSGRGLFGADASVHYRLDFREESEETKLNYGSGGSFPYLRAVIAVVLGRMVENGLIPDGLRKITKNQNQVQDIVHEEERERLQKEREKAEGEIEKLTGVIRSVVEDGDRMAFETDDDPEAEAEVQHITGTSIRFDEKVSGGGKNKKSWKIEELARVIYQGCGGFEIVGRV